MNDSATLRPARPHALVLGLLLVWFTVAVVVGLSGLFYRAPAFVVGGTNATLVTLSLLALFFVGPLRAWAMAVPLRVLVLYHTVRFVGIAFLVLYAKGTIPGAFALTAGWGDIAVAVAAMAVALWALPITGRGRWWAVLAWNVSGLADILFVLSTGLRLGLADLEQMVWITVFPLSLLPTFIVPLVFVTHVLIFVRLWRPSVGRGGAGTRSPGRP